MGFAEAIAHDWTCWDDLEWVLIKSTRNADYQVDRLQAMRRALTFKEQMASGGAYQNAALIWHVPGELLGWTPKAADVLTDEKTKTAWTVLQVDQDTVDWQLTTISLSILYDLRDVIDIERATVAYDAAGAAVKVFPGDPVAGGTVPYPQLSCRVQPQSQEAIEEREVRGPKTVYEVLLSQQVDVTTEDRIKWVEKSGNVLYLEIRVIHDVDRIDQLPKITAELMP